METEKKNAVEKTQFLVINVNSNSDKSYRYYVPLILWGENGIVPLWSFLLKTCHSNFIWRKSIRQIPFERISAKRLINMLHKYQDHRNQRNCHSQEKSEKRLQSLIWYPRWDPGRGKKIWQKLRESE